MHMSKLRPGRAPPLSRGRWCAPGRRLSSGRHLPLSCGQSLRPRWNNPSTGGTFTRRHRRFTAFTHHPGQLAVAPKPEGHPASRRSSPRPRPPDGTTAASASTSGFAPRSYPRRTPRRRQAIAHWPGYYATGLSRASNGASHLNSCTLTSHVVARGLQRDHLDARRLSAGGPARGSRAHPGLHRPHGAAPGAGPGRMRGAGAHHPGVLRHVDRGHPLMDPLVLFVVDHLRSPATAATSCAWPVG